MQVGQRFGFAALVLALAFLASAPASAESGYVFVRNAKNAVSRVDNGTLRAMLASQTKLWPGGAPVTLVLHGESSDHMGWLAHVYYGTSRRVVFGKILDKALAGSNRMPVLAHDDAEALSAVARTEGSIAVVKAGTPLPAGVALLEIAD
jgi:hypothetical protein